jgi:hypothetical protein
VKKSYICLKKSMYMQLSTGLVQPENGHYNTDNLERIIKALLALCELFSASKTRPRRVLSGSELGAGSRAFSRTPPRLKACCKTCYKIAANAETIRKELQDLDGAELTKIVHLVAQQGEFAAPKKWLTESVPMLLDAIQSFVKTR